MFVGKETEMSIKRFSHVLSLGLLILMTACQSTSQPLSAVLSQSGEATNGMSLTTGAADASPLWAYCSPSQENTHIRTFHCRAPAWQTLAVGHLFLLTDAALLERREADLKWQLTIDDRIVDLESFGTFDYVMPAMPASPSPIRKVFARVTDWNLVMTNLSPGEHVLSFRAQNETESYMWLVQLVIEPADRAEMSAAPFPLHS
jgi:hypothetical protein